MPPRWCVLLPGITWVAAAPWGGGLWCAAASTAQAPPPKGPPASDGMLACPHPGLYVASHSAGIVCVETSRSARRALKRAVLQLQEDTWAGGSKFPFLGAGAPMLFGVYYQAAP